MAKFKVGDKVERTGGQYAGAPMIVKKVESDGMVTAYFEDNGPSGIPYTLHESAFKVWRNSCSSTNPVVANALAARNADGDPESLVNWKRIYPKLKEFNILAGWLKGEGVKLMNVARNFDDKKFHSVGHDVQFVCEWAERKSAEILNRV